MKIHRNERAGVKLNVTRMKRIQNVHSLCDAQKIFGSVSFIALVNKSNDQRFSDWSMPQFEWRNAKHVSDAI